MKSLLTILILLSFNSLANSQMNEINSPIKNFDQLWKEFDLRYANFALKKIDWDEIYEKYRSQVNENTKNIKLLEICCSMLHELNDGHVMIQPRFEEDDDIECGAPYEFSLDLEFNTSKKFIEFESLIINELTTNGFSEPIKTYLSEDTKFQYRLSENFAYLRFDEMTEKHTFGKFKRTVDHSIEAFQNKKGLIIDLRFNGGGRDYYAYLLARRFIPKGKSVGHYERERIKGTDSYTAMKYKEFTAAGRYQFTGPIVILTSDFTASACEVFLLVMMDLPNVTIIGDATEGIFSDMYPFKLPNKWIATLSHQQYFSQSKENFEGKGISPDIQMVNSHADLKTKSDPVINAAIEFLREECNR